MPDGTHTAAVGYAGCGWAGTCTAPAVLVEHAGLSLAQVLRNIAAEVRGELGPYLAGQALCEAHARMSTHLACGAAGLVVLRFPRDPARLTLDELG